MTSPEFQRADSNSCQTAEEPPRNYPRQNLKGSEKVIKIRRQTTLLDWVRPHIWPTVIKTLIKFSGVETHSFQGRNPVWLLLPCKAIKLSFSVSPKTLSLGFDSASVYRGASQVVLMVKDLPANARAMGSIPGLGRSPVGVMETNILVRKIPWTEEPGGVQSIGSQRVEHNWSDLAGTCTVYREAELSVTLWPFFSWNIIHQLSLWLNLYSW